MKDVLLSFGTWRCIGTTSQLGMFIYCAPEFRRTSPHVVSTSLDDTEFIGQAPANSLAARGGKAVFFGVLEIESLEWLSEQGFEYLEKDLQERDEKAHMSHSKSGLTLRTLYGHRKDEGSHIKVRICCDKSMTAHFLTG